MMEFSKTGIKDDAPREAFERWVGIVAERNDPDQAFELQCNQGRAEHGGLDAIKILQNVLELHASLKRQSMAERDSTWTTWVNITYREQPNQVASTVSGALSLHDRPADNGNEHLQPIFIFLAWFLASSDRTLRGCATKALTTVFLAEASTIEFILERMYDCNDPYVVERLYAAAFGACCNDQSPQRLRAYSQAVFAKAFADGNPLITLLTRDYTLGIIELADSEGTVNDHTTLNDSRSLYWSDAPEFGLTEEELREIAEKSGGDRIPNSTTSYMGDFGKYTIPQHVGRFTNSRFGQPRPDKNVGRLSEPDIQQKTKMASGARNQNLRRRSKLCLH